MKKLVVLVLGLGFLVSCSNDDDGTKEMPQPDTFDFNEDLDGDLSNDNASPTSLSFVTGQNTIAAVQSAGDVDYFTFTVPEGSELTEIVLDEYQSSDDVAFIGIANGDIFPKDALSTEASDLLGGTLYGVANRGQNIITSISELDGAQGFTGALPAGSYSVWLNQTGDDSEVSLNFKITKI